MRLIIDGAHFTVRAAGNGPAIVLLHGFPLDSSTWDVVGERLAERARVVRFDFRGLGATSVTPGPYLMESLAGDLAEVLDALAIERAVITGHSLGGYVALAFFRLFAERCAGLGLIATRVSADSRETAAMRLALADRVEREGMGPASDAYVPKYFAPPIYGAQPGLVDRAAEIVRRTDPRGAAAMLRGMAARVGSEDLFEEMRLPVAVVAGSADALIPLEEALLVARAVPSCEASVLACGHMPLVEEPLGTAHALERLLERSAL